MKKKFSLSTKEYKFFLRRCGIYRSQKETKNILERYIEKEIKKILFIYFSKKRNNINENEIKTMISSIFIHSGIQICI